MLRVIMLVIALLLDPALTTAADMADCSQLSKLSTTRLRWAAARKSRADAAQKEEICLSYGSYFFEAVTTRQAASLCENVIDRSRLIELLDSEIDAFNNLIATQCGG